MVASSCFPFLFWTSKQSSNGKELIFAEGTTNLTLYSYKELKNASKNFGDANKLGQGGFGAVYKAELRDGTLAAIKVLSSDSLQGVKEFMTEIDVISKFHHENLVQLYGCCIEERHYMLVYEFLENNSLDKTLLAGNKSGYDFSWVRRRKICIGIARGLAFLHEAKPHIVHRDIKASNILLDKELNAKISDFGLAKHIPPNKTHATTRVAGTIGYVAPEYAFSGHVTKKADVYSFGVLLIEIICGRKNTNVKLSAEERYILEKVWQSHERNELVTIVDPNLDGLFDAEEACRFLKIGLLCTQDNPKSRPQMSKVVRMLEGKEGEDMFLKISKPALISEFLMPREESNGGTTTSYENSDASSWNTTTISNSL